MIAATRTFYSCYGQALSAFSRSNRVRSTGRLQVALAIPLVLAARDVNPKAARETLRERGFSRIETAASPWIGRPCDLTEIHARTFVAFDWDGRRVAGTICALDSGGESARILGQLAPVPAWDSFGWRR